MLVPIEWLKDYIDMDVSDEEFCDRMIMSGSNLETCEHFCEEMENVVVGKIEKIEKHPDADKLVVCRVNTGGDDLVQIVTGAPECVRRCACVPVALHKSRIPGPLHGQPKQEGGVKITKGKLQRCGIFRYAVLCQTNWALKIKSYRWHTRTVSGSWKENITLGQDFAEALGLRQAVVDFEITPNRPDCLAMVGMAREASGYIQEAVHIS